MRDPYFTNAEIEALTELKNSDSNNAIEVKNQVDTGKIRQFDTGATRDTDEGKNDYEGFLSYPVLEAFGDYMTVHRKQSNGELRDSDNWMKGIPRTAYIKSMFRHFLDVWALHRGYKRIDKKTGQEIKLKEALCALLFNVQGYLHEYLKENEKEN